MDIRTPSSSRTHPAGQGRPRRDRLIAVARAQTAALLVLVIVAGAGFAPNARTAAAQDEGTGSAASGTRIPGMVTIQGIVAQDNDRAGSYEYLVDITASASVADGYRVAGAGEQTYIAVDSTTFQDIDVASTDANGIAVLDGEVGASFYVYEVDDVDAGGIPLGTDDLFLPADDPNPAISLTGIFYVAGPAVSPEPSLAPTVEPSVDPLPSGAATGTILPDAISVQGLVVEDAGRAGETEYLIDVTFAAEVGDYRSARAGEQTYQVVDLTTEQVIDSASTDANGQVVLDGEVGAAYYVVEVNDAGSIPGTDSLFYAAGDPNAFIALTAVVYVAQLEPVPSPSPNSSPSPDLPVSPVPVASGSAVASPSGIASPSAEGSPSGVVDPSGSARASASPDTSADPSSGDPSPGDAPDDSPSAQPGATVAGDGIARPSATASRAAAPVISARDAVGALPDTGAGPGPVTTPLTALAALLAVAAVMVAAIALALRRRPA